MSCICSSHELARELLNKPDGFIIARDKNGYQEFAISDVQRIFTCANSDDSIMNWAINLHDCTGIIKR